jgi:hypothetical protein
VVQKSLERVARQESHNETRGIKGVKDEIFKFLNKRSYINSPPLSSATTTASMYQAKR